MGTWGNGMEPRSEDVVRWLETQLGARVVEIEMQPRWRPVWFAAIERNGRSERVCVRGDRTDVRHGFSLENEMKLQQLLHNQLRSKHRSLFLMEILLPQIIPW